MQETALRTYKPSIFQYLHLFLTPAVVYLVPLDRELEVVRQGVFWGLELVALVFTWSMVSLNTYTITNLRVKCSTFSFKELVRTHTAIPIENITEIYVRQNPLQGICGIGNLEVDTAGGDGVELVMVGIEKPIETQGFILGLKEGIQ